MFPYFLIQLFRASSGYHIRKGNEPESIVSPVEQDRRQQFRLTHNWQAPRAVGDLVSLLVNQNTIKNSVEQHDETSSSYDSKGDKLEQQDLMQQMNSEWWHTKHRNCYYQA